MSKNYSLSMKKVKGFTLIELLIVIAVLGILVVAILSAIDPLEQIRKARDAGRKSDAAELLSAYERYYTTFQCYPWDTLAPNCSTVITASRTGATNPDFGTGGDDYELVTQGELKQQFTTRSTIDNDELWISENATTRQSTVCFEPESKTGRQGGYGDLSQSAVGTGTSPNCTAAYVGGGASTQSCWVCLPQ